MRLLNLRPIEAHLVGAAAELEPDPGPELDLAIFNLVQKSEIQQCQLIISIVIGTYSFLHYLTEQFTILDP